MLLGLDSSISPTLPQAQSYKTKGWSFYGCYIGGNTPHIWTKQELLTVSQAGLQLLPIWVAPFGTPSYDQGVNEGNACLAAMQQRGLSGVCVLDVENGATPSDYIRGFVDAMHAGSAGVCIYGSAATIYAAWNCNVDKTWLVDPISTGQSIDQALPDFDIWQFSWAPVTNYNVAVNDYPFAQIQ